MRRLILLAVCVILAGACGDSKTDDSKKEEPNFTTLKVPEKYPTIQQAIDAAHSGDLVLVDKGTYKEEVKIETEGVTLRGVDRNEVIIDGEFERENGVKVFSNHVAVENLTVRNHKANGVFFTGDYSDDPTKDRLLTGYRMSYITAYNNGLYGLYAFNATDGLIEHSYGSGHPDSAFYIGQCKACNALIRDVTGEYNMLGYSGTNSTGVTIINSTFQNNRAGIVPNSLTSEKHAPNAGTTMIGNRVLNNNSDKAPRSPSNNDFNIAFGNGIILAGTSNAKVERNLVMDQKLSGIAITDLPGNFKPERNVVKDNVVKGNKYGAAYLIVGFPTMTFGNCFEGNGPDPGFPAMLFTDATCGAAEKDLGDVSAILAEMPTPPPEVDWKTVMAPGAQENMPNAMTEAPSLAGAPPTVDLAAIKTPTS
jgi:hypothetical protein